MRYDRARGGGLGESGGGASETPKACDVIFISEKIQPANTSVCEISNCMQADALIIVRRNLLHQPPEPVDR